MSAQDGNDERAALLAQAAAYLEWEQELGGSALPLHDLSAASTRASTAASAPVARLSATPQQVPAAPLPAQPDRQPAHERPDIDPQIHRVRPSEQAASGPAPGERAGLAALSRTLPPLRLSSPEQVAARLAVLQEEVTRCSACELHKGRTHTVFSRGHFGAPVMFVGEGPGQEEDRTGQPFVGPAGQLLDRMIAAMGLGAEQFYICNVVKCRPPNNRTPLPSEAGACAGFLLGQIDLVRPRVIVALGRCAAENMGLVAGGSWRGRWGRFRDVEVMPTYHPAFLLRSPEYKRPVWEDLQKVMAKLRSQG